MILRTERSAEVARAVALVVAGIGCLAISSCNSQPSASPDDPFADIVEGDRDSLGFYLQYPEVYQEAMDLGVTVVNLDDPPTYFVFWFPPGFELEREKRMLVMLHGSDGVAYRSLLRMSVVAEEEGFGIVAIQWGWPDEWGQEYDYLDPEDTFDMVSTALDYLEYAYGIDKHLSALDGFSMASTRSPVHANIDVYFGTYYFTLFLSISGACMATYPPMEDLLEGVYGPTPLDGCHFYFWCGTEDLDGKRCLSLETCAGYVDTLGGIVERFTVAEGLDHADYYMEIGRDYQREAVAIWKSIEPRR